MSEMVVYLYARRPGSAEPANFAACPPRRNRGAAVFPELVSQKELDRPAKRIRGIVGSRLASSASIASDVLRRQPVLCQILATVTMIALIVVMFH